MDPHTSATPLKLAKLDGYAEIFHSLQGEGVNLGVPSVFIRSSLCNLHCRWCDTDYTWNWEGTPWQHDRETSESGYQKFKRKEYIVEMPIPDVVAKIDSFSCYNIILTGGEPLQQEAAWVGLMQLLTSLNPAYRFEVETNGTLVPSEVFDDAVHQYNVSPKLSNSGNPDNLRINPDALSFFSVSPKAWYKFVIAEPTDLEEVETLISQYNLPQARVILMPEGRDETSLQHRRLWLADICRDRNYRYSDRLHIQLWGSKRGV